ncbi:TonB-dependent receptor [Paucibacter sp. R3-3]|uniref:TonB-dependent receptor n=1 Tax=Roseateles agri TaxID=3098619 RepID=A0ABU5DNV6_9BURK|nr:TonB-dependent receptor [Paucibacter sp. R3-3]MDY0747995.1 TonB-dependent receptor [Paucibacter sp. R3-3]
MKARPTLIALAAAAAVTASAPAFAQDEGGVQNLGVVQVTGQSRVQQLQEVPITMSVLGAETIKAVGATSMAGLDGLIPGLKIEASQPTQPEYSMRGLGSGDFGIGTDAPVGIYLNGVYAGKTGGALLNFNDVKRIEVLKGPQGTLFGRNAAGGALSIISNEPGREREASVLLRLGDQGQRHGEALFNAPINDSTAFRFSVVREHKDGWQTNLYDGSKWGGDDGWGTRAAVKWVGENTTALLTWEHESMSQKPRAIIALPSDEKLATNPFPEDPSTWVNPIRKTFTNNYPFALESRRFDGVTLRLTHDLDFATFTSTTAYRGFTAQNVQDNDGNGVFQTSLSTGNFEKNKSWQQEFRLNGTTDKLDWVAGVSAYYEDAKQQTALYSNTQTVDLVVGNASGGLLTPFGITNQLASLFGVPGINVSGLPWTESMFNTGKYKAAAAYGDVIWKLTKDTNVTAGIRFTHDSKSFSWYNPPRIAPELDATLAALNGGGFFDGVTANQADIAQSFGVPLAYLQAALAANSLSTDLGKALQQLMGSNINFNSPEATNAVVRSSAAWNNTSPRLVIDHHLNKDTMVFGSVTRGYQAGGFNAIYKEGISTFSPETITNYELGIKGSLKEAGLFYTASLFHYDFNNLQSIGTSKSSEGILTYIVNVSDQKATGIDLEGAWQINSNWRLSGATEFINQTYKRYSYAKDADTSIDMAGQAVGTPRVTATLGLNARYGMLGGEGSATLNWAYSSAERCNSETSDKYMCGSFPAFRVGGPTSRFDLRVGWDAPQKKWGIAAIVQNLTDKQYVAYVSSLGSAVGSRTANVTSPRAVAIEVNFKM